MSQPITHDVAFDATTVQRLALGFLDRVRKHSSHLPEWTSGALKCQLTVINATGLKVAEVSFNRQLLAESASIASGYFEAVREVAAATLTFLYENRWLVEYTVVDPQGELTSSISLGDVLVGLQNTDLGQVELQFQCVVDSNVAGCEPVDDVFVTA